MAQRKSIDINGLFEKFLEADDAAAKFDYFSLESKKQVQQKYFAEGIGETEWRDKLSSTGYEYVARFDDFIAFGIDVLGNDFKKAVAAEKEKFNAPFEAVAINYWGEENAQDISKHLVTAKFASFATPKIPVAECETAQLIQNVWNNEMSVSEKEQAVEPEKALDPRHRNTVIVNAFGGAGAGKTTACLHIVAELKKQGFVAEYVPEYAKELVWDKNFDLLDGSMESQKAILKEQRHRVDRLIGQVDFVVTDSPILLNGIYLKDCPGKEAYCKDLLEKFNSYTNFNLVIRRDAAKYEREGRIQSLEESIVIDNDITAMLKQNNIYFGTYDHSRLDIIVGNVIRTFKKNTEVEKENSPVANSIFGDTKYSDINDKFYVTVPADNAQEISQRLSLNGIKHSGRIYENGSAKITISRSDAKAYKKAVSADKEQEKSSVLNEINSIKKTQEAKEPAEKPKAQTHKQEMTI